MLGYRLRCQPNIEPALGTGLVFAVLSCDVEPMLF